MNHKLPSNMIDIYSSIDTEVRGIHLRWATFIQLFGTSTERIKLLNAGAPLIAWLLQETLWDDAVLSICRLLDQKKTREKNNLTIDLMIDRIRQNGAASLADELHNIRRELESQSKALRSHRNQRISHNDLNAIATPNILPPLERKAIDEALCQLRLLMNRIQNDYGIDVIEYQAIDYSTHDPTFSFLRTLACGLRYQELVRDRALPRTDMTRNSPHNPALQNPGEQYNGPTGPMSPYSCD